MAILLKLLTLPVTGPIEGVLWIARKVAEQADKELYDPERVRGQLMEMELLFDSGEISEADYLAAERVLLERLRIIRERQTAGREE